MGVITPLDIREDLQFGFFVCAEGTSVEELTFEIGKIDSHIALS